MGNIFFKLVENCKLQAQETHYNQNLLKSVIKRKS